MPEAADHLPIDDVIVTSEASGHRMLSKAYVMSWLGRDALELAEFAVLSGNKRAAIHPDDERNMLAETALLNALEAAGAFEEKDT